jgi:hypothetical protein
MKYFVIKAPTTASNVQLLCKLISLNIFGKFFKVSPEITPIVGYCPVATWGLTFRVLPAGCPGECLEI